MPKNLFAAIGSGRLARVKVPIDEPPSSRRQRRSTERGPHKKRINKFSSRVKSAVGNRGGQLATVWIMNSTKSNWKLNWSLFAAQTHKALSVRTCTRVMIQQRVQPSSVLIPKRFDSRTASTLDVDAHRCTIRRHNPAGTAESGWQTQGFRIS